MVFYTDTVILYIVCAVTHVELGDKIRPAVLLLMISAKARMGTFR